MRQPGFLLVAFSIICCFLTASAKAQELRLGTPIERQLGPGDIQSFPIELTENEFVQLVVEQRGVDVVVRVVSPDGKTVGDFDTPNGDNGPENVSFVSTVKGVYSIFIKPLNQEGLPPATGKYQIKLIELRKATDEELKNTKSLAVLKTKGIGLLDDVADLIPELHSLHSRVMADLQTAQMLWSVDEKRARKYMNDAIAGVKEFLATPDDGTLADYPTSYNLMTQARWEILRVLNEHDPETALSFLYSSRPLSNPFGNERDTAVQERAMELQIANQMLDKDPKRTFDIARHSLKTGYTGDLMSTVTLLRAKNPELATQLATEIADKVLNEALLKDNQAGGLAMNLVTQCNVHSARTQGPGLQEVAFEPLLPEQTCRDLVQKSYQEAMAFPVPNNNAYTPERDVATNLLSTLRSIGPLLDVNVDGGKAAVEKRLTELNNAMNPYQETYQQMQAKFETGAFDAAVDSIPNAPEEIRNDLYNQAVSSLAAKGESARARQVINEHIKNPYQRRQALMNVDHQDLYLAISHGKVEEALRTIAALKSPRERASMLVQILRQVGSGQKREVALNYLEQARSLLAPGVQAQDQEQMYALIELARAFARLDSKRAFEIIDPLVEQVNELCAAARVLDGFGGQFFQDDQLSLSNGNNVANAVTQVSYALGGLAVSNFERARLTADRLRLPEVRLRAYLNIAQQSIEGPKN
jgi:hypothetical protein